MKKKMIFIMIISTLSHMGYAALISFQPALSSDHVAISSSIGMLKGKSLETVYDANTGHKESQLTHCFMAPLLMPDITSPLMQKYLQISLTTNMKREKAALKFMITTQEVLNHSEENLQGFQIRIRS